jgi:hypothetical protein
VQKDQDKISDKLSLDLKNNKEKGTVCWLIWLISINTL